MTSIKRLLTVLVPCLLFILVAATAAMAAPSDQGAESSNWGSVYGYNDNNGYGNATSANEAVLAATPTINPVNSLQSYWNKYYGSSFNQKPVNTAPTTTPSTTTKPTTTPTTPTTTPTTSTDTSGLTAEQAQLLALVNQDRANAGLPALTIDSALQKLAQEKSDDMAQNNYFSHTSPTYGTALDMERNAGLSYRVMGAENIAKAATVSRAEELFMNSPGHKANILDPQETCIGIGVTDTAGGVVVSQMFAAK